MGQDVQAVDAMTLHKFAALAHGWRRLHPTEDDKNRITDEDAVNIAAFMDSPNYEEG